jgi:hypothetical protein
MPGKSKARPFESMVFASLLIILLAGIVLMGYGLGDSYLHYSQPRSPAAMLTGFVVCILACAIMGFASPEETIDQDGSQ